MEFKCLKEMSYSGLYRVEPSYASFQASAAVRMRTSFFCDLTQRRLVVSLPACRDSLSVPFAVSGQLICPICKGQALRITGPLKTVQMVCLEKSVTNLHFLTSRKAKNSHFNFLHLRDWELLHLQK